MRTIQVSTDVYAKIWASRRDGEESEDAILRRHFGCEPRPFDSATAAPELKAAPSVASNGGVYAANVDVRFPEGFEIFRNYKGKAYKARATGGRWLLLNNNQTYPSLHKLSWAIVERHENSWTNWKYKRSDGQTPFIDDLRPEERINRRQV